MIKDVPIHHDDVTAYLNHLYNSDYKRPSNFAPLTVYPTIRQKNDLKKYVEDNVENFIFNDDRANISLKRDDVQTIVSQGKTIYLNIFSELFFTLDKYNNLSYTQHDRSNRAVLSKRYKGKGDRRNPQNYRYYYYFSNNMKLLDKIWCHKVISELSGKLDNRRHLSFYGFHEINNNFKVKAVEFTNSMDNKIMLDLVKAFDSVSFPTLEKLLKGYLVRKLGEKKGTTYFEQYFNRIIHTRVFYNGTEINRNKGLPTGLPSSTFVFTCLMDELFFLFMKNYPTFTKYFEYQVYVDDIGIHVLDNTIDIREFMDPLFRKFTDYGFSFNPAKCQISNNIANAYKDFSIITKDTKYLGIYFARDVTEYIEIVVNEFNERYQTNFENIASLMDYNQKAATGFLNYRLTPFLLRNENFLTELL